MQSSAAVGAEIVVDARPTRDQVRTVVRHEYFASPSRRLLLAGIVVAPVLYQLARLLAGERPPLGIAFAIWVAFVALVCSACLCSARNRELPGI